MTCWSDKTLSTLVHREAPHVHVGAAHTEVLRGVVRPALPVARVRHVRAVLGDVCRAAWRRIGSHALRLGIIRLTHIWLSRAYFCK